MPEQEILICGRIQLVLRDINSKINLLYTTPHMSFNYTILYHIRCKMQELEFLNHLLCMERTQQPSQVPPRVQPPQSPPTIPDQRTFTLEELAAYNGRNGNPAYVAVNGIVYDVTQNAAWAAATHFGLSAGRDLTGEFTSCHQGQAGQQILSRLLVVGRLVG